MFFAIDDVIVTSVTTYTVRFCCISCKVLSRALYVLLVQYEDVSDCGAVGAIILVYSITSQQSFEFVVNQLRDMRDAADPTPVLVVANKTDLVRTRQVSEDGQSTRSFTPSSRALSTVHCAVSVATPNET